MYPTPELKKTNVKVYPYGHGKEEELDILGYFPAKVKLGDDDTDDRVYVSRCFNNDISLLSRKTSKKLGIVSVNIPTFAAVNYISDIPKEGRYNHPLLDGCKEICIGVGKHTDLTIDLSLKEGAQPTMSRPTRIPFNLMEPVKRELERLTKEGVFEPVPPDSSPPFVSPLVAVPKRTPGSSEVGVRLTMDWRELNKCLKPIHQSTPSVEDLKYLLNGAGEFLELDINDAFYQLQLNDKSKEYTTFSTPWGLMRSTRLVQGATPSSSICHEVLRKDLEGIRGALNIADNILVWGCGETKAEIRQDHDRALKEVFDMLKRKGLTIHPKKCKFNATELKFFGFIFSKDGMMADPEKVDSVLEAGRPETKNEVKSFLGFAQFNAQFMEDFATITEPLRRLTKKGVKYDWSAECEDLVCYRRSNCEKNYVVVL